MIGPNGAGKSTLLRTTAGLLPHRGEVTLDGQSLAAMNARERARAIGYLPQDHLVHWDVTARDLVALGRAPHRNPMAAESAADRTAVDDALVATDSTTFAERGVLTLSGGERARVLLARVLAGTPRWILADEPLASLDPAHQFAMLGLFRAQAVAGRGVAIVLHDLTLAARFADDAILIDRGGVVAAGPVAEVLTPDRIAAVFGVAARRLDDSLVLDGPISR